MIVIEKHHERIKMNVSEFMIQQRRRVVVSVPAPADKLSCFKEISFGI